MKSSFMGVHILHVMIAYGVFITKKVSDHCYDLGDKGKGHIYFKLALRLLTHSNLAKSLLRYVDTMKVTTVTLESKVKYT